MESETRKTVARTASTRAVQEPDATAGTAPANLSVVAEGSVFNVRYPFVRDTWMAHDNDVDGIGETEVPTWKPGTRYEARGREGEYTDCLADGMGVMVLSVVSVHRPGKYRPRVFYVRQWVDPDGKVFGVRKLRMSGLAAFKAICHGYRFPFEMAVLAKVNQ